MTSKTIKAFETTTRMNRSLNVLIDWMDNTKYEVVSVAKWRISFRYKTHPLRKRWTYIVIKGRTQKRLYQRLWKFHSKVHDQRNQGSNRFPSRYLRQRETPVYVNKRIMTEYYKVADLLCIPKKYIPELRIYPKAHRHSGRNCGNVILVGAKNGVAMTTIIHELLHCMFDHTKDINGYSDYAHQHGKDYYSPLVCKDLYGKKEMIIR